MVPTHDSRGFLSAGADETLKFWDFKLLASEGGPKALGAVHHRTLQPDKDVTCVAASQDSRLAAVALLDSNTNVVLADSLKFFLSLYSVWQQVAHDEHG